MISLMRYHTPKKLILAIFELGVMLKYLSKNPARPFRDTARTYLQLPFWQWGAGNVYLLVLSS